MSAVPGSIFHIDGAIVFPAMSSYEKDGETWWRIPSEHDRSYQYGMISSDGLMFPLASIDGNHFVVAIAYLIDGEEVSAYDVAPLYMSGMLTNK